MTPGAFFSKLAIMNVIGTMAGNTFRLGLAMCVPCCMAVAARYAQVRTLQYKVGERVIERGFVEIDDVHVTPFVVGVTGRALESLRLREPAVKTGFASDIGSHFRVACDAQVSLRHIGHGCMTFIALCFDISMAGYDRSGHDQPLLDLSGTCGRRNESKRQREHTAKCRANVVNTTVFH